MSDESKDKVNVLAEKFVEQGIEQDIATILAKIAIEHNQDAPRPTAELNDETVQKIIARLSTILDDKLDQNKVSILRVLLESFLVSITANATFVLLQNTLLAGSAWFGSAESEEYEETKKKAWSIREASYGRFSAQEQEFLEQNYGTLDEKLRFELRSEIESLIRKADIVDSGTGKMLSTSIIAPIIEDNILRKPFKDSI